MNGFQRALAAFIKIGILFMFCAILSGDLWFFRDDASAYGLLFDIGGLSIIMGKYISEPFFVTPSDVFENSLVALFLMVGLDVPAHLARSQHETLMTWGYGLILALLCVLLVCTVILLYLNAGNKGKDFRKRALKLMRTLGKSEVIYSMIYVYAAFLFFANTGNRIVTIILIAVWLFLIFCPLIDRTIDRLVTFSDTFTDGGFKGSIIDFAPEKYCVASFPSISQSIDDSSHLLLMKQGNKGWLACQINKVENLPSETVVSGICIPDALIANDTDVPQAFDADMAENISRVFKEKGCSAYLVDKAKCNTEKLKQIEDRTSKRILGYVDDLSDDKAINVHLFKDESDAEYQSIGGGTIIEAKINSDSVLYQVVGGIDRRNEHNNKALCPFVQVNARKIGVYDSKTNAIKSAGWLPEYGSPVYLNDIDTKGAAKERAEVLDQVQDQIGKSASNLSIGQLPGTDYDICLRDVDALITHNSVILGVMGIGKSCLAFDIITKISEDEGSPDLKIICIDVTRQYRTELSHCYGVNLYDPADEKKEYANRQDFEVAMRKLIDGFMKDSTSDGVMVIDPEDYLFISKDESAGEELTSAEKSEIISEVAFDYCKNGYDECCQEAKLLLVFEEAHVLIPERTGGKKGERAAANGIARIFIQGRKYGLGALIVTQRPANVSKTVLTQCNTIFALRLHDAGNDFLRGIVGKEFADRLVHLEERHAVVYGKGLGLPDPVEIKLNKKPSEKKQHQE